MMAPGVDRTGFSDVDASGFSDYFIDYLDDARRQPVIAESKEWSLRQLQLESGQRALDVGCGTGEDVVAMSTQVGPTGEAVGLDSSHYMIAEALKRHRHVAQVSFRIGDAHMLPFESQRFDGCRAERTLQHLSDPDRAVAEIARVLRVGGRVALIDPDFETLVIAGSDPAMSAKIWLNHMQRLPQPRMGRRLRGLLTANGFTNIGLAAGVVMHTDFEHSKRVFGLTAAAVRAAVTGIIADEEAEGWLADLQRASDTKQFFCAVTTFRVSGFKA